MKDTTKWILAAIAVILIIAVGAYAYSNGNGSPTATPTAIPTATPTATPAVSATAEPTVTPAPTAAPSATPAPTTTPTPPAGSGVKQTEFGYYITYPPFSYNDVHEGPHYAAPSPSPSPSASPPPTPEGTVTFVYGYGSLNWNYGEPESSSSIEYGDPVDGNLPVYFLLHRTGDISNAYWTDIEVSESISGWGYNSANPGFSAGSDEMVYELDLPVSYLTDNVYTEVTLTLDDPDPYTATPHQVFWLYINGEET